MGAFDWFSGWFQKNKSHFTKEQVAEIEKLLESSKSEVNDRINDATNGATKKLEDLMGRQSDRLFDEISTAKQYCTSEIGRLSKDLDKLMKETYEKGDKKKKKKKSKKKCENDDEDEDEENETSSEYGLVLDMLKMLIREKTENNFHQLSPMSGWNPYMCPPGPSGCCRTAPGYGNCSSSHQHMPWFNAYNHFLLSGHNGPMNPNGSGCEYQLDQRNFSCSAQPNSQEFDSNQCQLVSDTKNQQQKSYNQYQSSCDIENEKKDESTFSSKHNLNATSSEKVVAQTVKNFFLTYNPQDSKNTSEQFSCSSTSDPMKPRTYSMEQIEDMRAEATSLRSLVEEFTGTSDTNDEYQSLDKMLSMLLLDLEAIEINENVKLLSTRDELIRHVKKSIAILGSKVYLN